MNLEYCQIAVIGAGPGGLAVATELKVLGVDKVILLEREASAGGIPRHCGHSPFGMREFHRVLSGAEYARRLRHRAEIAGVDLRLNTTVTEISHEGELILSTEQGKKRIMADKVVICTGAREKPRSSRLVSGSRPQGVVTTGALQGLIYLKQQRPFKRPVIIGSEMVSFSALLSCRHAGMKPVAMIEAEPVIKCWRISALLPRFLGIELMTGTMLEEICGQENVSVVKVRRTSGQIETIECDGIVFSGNFIGESSLAKIAGFDIDMQTNSPLLDAFGRCSNLDFFACGNINYPLKTAGQCWYEGRKIAKQVWAALQGDLPE